MKTNHIVVFSLLILAASTTRSLHAQSTLTSESAKSFIDFYFDGQGQGVVLADIKLCTEIIENQCEGEVSPIELQQGVTYMVWMMYVVPQGDEVDGIILQYNSGGITRKTAELTVKGSIRYRTWKSFTPNRIGNWDIVVLIDNGGEFEALNTITVTVNE